MNKQELDRDIAEPTVSIADEEQIRTMLKAATPEPPPPAAREPPASWDDLDHVDDAVPHMATEDDVFTQRVGSSTWNQAPRWRGACRQ
jgi:hypothetical protein